jgi:hypothetical protein
MKHLSRNFWLAVILLATTLIILWGNAAMAMTLNSLAFKQNGHIPSKYTCEGEDVSPPLAWEGVPDGAKSLVLIIDDLDAPDPKAPKMVWVALGVEIGRPNDNFRRVRIASDFGDVVAMVTDGHLPFPYGHEITGYEIASLSDTLEKARTAGAKLLVEPYLVDGRRQIR